MSSKESKDILQKFKKAREKRQLKDEKWKELDAFDRGEQWKLNGSVPAWIPRPVTNFVHLVKTTKRAALAIENPTGQLRPQSPDDRVMVEDLQKGYEFVWDKAGCRKVVREALETSKLLGTGIVQVYWDENTGVLGGTGGLYEGEIKVKQLDPASVYPDPTAFSIEDCQYIHVVERKPVEWLKKHPLFGDSSLEERNVSETERGEIYQRDHTHADMQGMIDFHQHFEKKPNKDGGYTHSVTYLAGEKVVHKIDRLEPNCYPFAILYDYPQRQDFWGMSTCELILDNQKLINKVESIIAMIGTLLQNPQKVVFKGSGINPKEAAKYSSAPGKVWVSNVPANQAIAWQQPPQIPPALFNLAEQAKQNIREVTGLTEAYMGQSVGSLQTSQGVSSLIERSTMRDRDQMFDLELFVKELSNILIKFITSKYTEERWIRIMGEQDREPEFTRFLGTDYRMLSYDIHVDVSAKAPISRARQQEEARQLLEMQGQYGLSPRVITPQEFIKNSNFVNKNELLDRMDKEQMENMAEQITQMGNMIAEAVQNQVPPEEIQQMAMEMAQQIEGQAEGGIGSASSGSIQQQQAGL